MPDHSLFEIKAISLDAAGTIIDLKEPVADVYARIASSFGIDIAPCSLRPAFREAFAIPSPDYTAFATGDDAEKAWWRQVVARSYHIASNGSFNASNPKFDAIFSALFDHYAHAGAWTLFPETLHVLKRLQRKKMRLCIASNLDARLHQVITGLQIGRYFEFILTSAKAKARKPDPTVFQQLKTQLDLEYKEILHVGDSEECDIVGARDLGLKSFHIQRPDRDLLSLLEDLEEIDEIG